MRILTKDEVEKLQFVDTLFCAIPTEELEKLAKDEEVIAVLKDKPISSGIFYDLYKDNIELNHQIAELRMHLTRTTQRLQELCVVLEKGPFSTAGHSDFQNLKSRIYY